MSSNTGAETDAAQTSQKRNLDETGVQSGGEKRVKTEPISYDASLDNLFAPLPFESKDSFTSSDYPIHTTAEIDLPDFLTDRPPANAENSKSFHQDNTSSVKPDPGPETPHKAQQINQNIPISYGQQASSNLPFNNGQVSAQQSPNPLSFPRVNMSSKLSQEVQKSDGSIAHGPSPLGPANTQSGIASTYQFQKTPATSFPNQYRPTANVANASPSGFKSGIRFDPKKTFPIQAAQPSPIVSMTHSNLGVTNYTATTGPQDKNKPEDPSKLNDALAAAGVDIQREEELLSTNYNRSTLNLHQQQMVNRQRPSSGSFLHPYHVALFMNRTARENGVLQNFMMDPEMLEFMSCACKEWISAIVTKTVALARHRRRGIPAFNPKLKAAGKQKVTPPSQRSEISKELRNLAQRQKELEERRVAKRALLGLEKNGDVAPDSGNKAGAEETLHRAANATAAMMTMNPSRKKYSWMTSTAGNSGDEIKGSGAKDSSAKQSSLISSRGDNGLRFREIRTGNMISSKDLLGALEDERIGTSKALVKGYARLKD